MTIKTFRGLLADNTQVKINLRTNDGQTGYKIVKFQIFPRNFNENEEYNMSVWKLEQTTLVSTHDFSDHVLLAAGFIETVSGATEGLNPLVVFDNEIFNQDIFVSLKSQSGNACNYYLELEQVKLTDNETTMATLQSIRSSYESYRPAGPS